MIDSETRAVLAKAKGIVAQGWCQGEIALDAFGNGTYAGCGLATSVCVVGALFEAIQSPVSTRTYKRAYTALAKAACAPFLPIWNDAPGRTQAEVVALFDRVLADNPAPTPEPIPDLVA